MADLYNMSDVFISYSRKDSEFVHKLFEDIKAQDKEVWADFEDIPKTADWWEEIRAGIDAADAFVFVISPDSITSDICRQEIEQAVASNKRFLPLLYREITEDEHKAKIHPAISSHNWIFSREADDYDEAFKTLMESLDTDLEHNRTLTRLLVRAKEWQENNQESSYLLQGGDLDNAENWLSEAMSKQPAPTKLHAEYITSSRGSASQRQRKLMIYYLVGMVLSLIMAIFAIYQMLDARQARDAAQDAQEQAEIAQEQAEDAREQAEESELEARAIALAANGREALANNNPDLALVLAEAAVNLETDDATVISSLADAAYAPGTVQRLPTNDVVVSVVYSPDGATFAAGFLNGEICLYDGITYDELHCLLNENDESAHADSVLWIHKNDEDTLLLSSGADDRLLAWDIDPSSETYGTILHSTNIPNLQSSALSSAGDFAVFGTDDGQFGFWEFLTEEIIYPEFQFTGALNVIALNANNSRAIVGTSNGALVEYEVADKSLIDIYANANNLSSISSVAYNPESTIVIAGDLSANLTSWDLETASIIRTYQGHDENVTSITFSANGRTIFTSSWDNSIREWDVSSGRIVQEFYGHNGGINGLSLTANNLYMVSGAFDNSMRVWLVRPIIFENQLVSNGYSLGAADWNNRHIVAADTRGDIFIYNRNSGELLHQLTDENGSSGAFYLDIRDDGSNFAIIYADCNVSLFNMRGELLWTTELEIGATDLCRQIAFRPMTDEIMIMSDTTFTLLDGRTGEMLGTVPYTPERPPLLRSFEFTTDGDSILLGENYRERNFHLIDIDTGDIIREYVGHTDGVLAIDLSSDGTKIVTGSFDNDVRVWQFADADSVAITSEIVFEGHSDRILDVSFNQNDTTVVSSSNDTTMRLWDLETGISRYTYRGHTDRVVNALFSEDGDRILTSSHDSTLIIWRFPQRLDELQTWIRQNRYLRSLTCTESARYNLDITTCDAYNQSN